MTNRKPVFGFTPCSTQEEDLLCPRRAKTRRVVAFIAIGLNYARITLVCAAAILNILRTNCIVQKLHVENELRVYGIYQLFFFFDPAREGETERQICYTITLSLAVVFDRISIIIF